MDAPEMARHDRMAQNVRITCQLREWGIATMLMKLRQCHRDDSDEELDRRLRAVLYDRPMDAPGTPITWEEWKAKRGSQ